MLTATDITAEVFTLMRSTPADAGMTVDDYTAAAARINTPTTTVGVVVDDEDGITVIAAGDVAVFHGVHAAAQHILTLI